ncbi:hypothetical protein BH24ACI4_BH24ACI4_26910 [soil metagenome]
MRSLRRLLQVAALVGTLIVGIVALALIVSQTPWFRDWMRRYIVRESKQYLNGELSIGSIGGNLLFGVQVNDVAVDMSGERVVAARNIEVDYNVFTIISQGVVLNEIKLVEPVVRLERDADGWNLGRLVKKQEKEADREGPGRPISLESIELSGARIEIVDHVGAEGYRLPEQISDLNLRASFEYEPVRYTVVVDAASFHTTSPQLALRELTGTFSVREDDLFVERMSIRTAESTLTVDGTVQNYLQRPVLNLSTTGTISVPEIARVVPAADGYDLRPRFTLDASGPSDALGLTLDLQTEAGNIRGQLTADVEAPEYAARGGLDIEGLNLAPLLKDPAQRSDVTGRAELDLRVAAAPEAAPITDRTTGTFSFTGPTVMAAGYQARDVRVSGTLKDGRVGLDGRAAAYGGTATARGFIVPPADGRPLAFDLRGAADGVDLRNLPADTGAPPLETRLSVAEYHVAGKGGTITGSAVLNESTVEGARLASGTAADVKTGPEGVSYSARGGVTGLNLQRVGRVMEIDALNEPAYDGEINGDFTVSGSMPPAGRAPRNAPALSTMTLNASGTLRNSSIMGGRLPELAFEAGLAGGALDVRAEGSFEDFNPGTLAERKELEGNVSGRVNVSAHVANLSEPITPESITADGTVSIESSEVGGLQITSAHVEGKYAGGVGDLARLQVSSPDLNVEASGRIALDRTSESDLKYHVEAVDLAKLAELAGQTGVTGSATLDGTLTGNVAALQTAGTMNGSNLGQGENNALDLNSTYSVTIPELEFVKARVEADTKATFVKAGGLEINLLTAKTTYENQRVDFTTHVQEQTRELDATGSLVLHPDHQEVHLPQLAVRTQGVEWRTAPGSDAAIQYGENRIELQGVRLVSGAQSLDVSGAIALNADAPAGDLKVQATGVDLQQLESLMLMDRGLSGTLSADATISGNAQDPVVQGQVAITNGGFETYKYDSLTANVGFANDRIDLDATLQQSPAEAITAKGSVPMSLFQPGPEGHVPPTEEDRVDLRIQSTAIDLGFLQGLTTQVTNITGTLQADVRVTGSGQDPHVEGFVDIKGGAFGVPLGGVSYSGLDTRIELAEDVVRLQKFSILDEEGQPLNVSGELAVHAREVGAVNIRIDAKNFELIDNQLGDVGIGTNLRITGELRRPVIQGDIRLQAGRLEVDRILQLFYDPYSIQELPPVVSAERTVEGGGSAQEATTMALRQAQTSAAVPGTKPEAGEGEGEQEAPAPGGALEPVSIDVRVVIPDNLVLRGRRLRPGGPTSASLGDINLTVGGDIQVVKQPGGPILLLGTVQTVRGMYDFQGRRFTLERGGTLRFIGEPVPNPALDITATRVIPNTGVEAQVRIQGTAQAPQLTLTSTPPLPEADILALIVFNRSVNELGTGERASLAATAGGIATGFIAAPLGESIGRALDLDLFEITTTTEGGDLGAGLTLGQQIGDRAFLRMRQQFGERSSTEFLLEYQLTDFLRLQTTAAPETTGSANRIGQRRIERAGIDLIFFFSY